MKFRASQGSQQQMLLFAVAFCVTLLTACDRKKQDDTQVKQPAASASDSEAPPARDPHGGAQPQTAKGQLANPSAKVIWKVPDGWKEMPPRPMRKTTYQAEGAAGPAEIGVFYFGPSDGGGVEANITRWIGQFDGASKDDAKRAENKVGELTVHTVRIEKGTYSSGMPGAAATAQEGWGMHAAVVETPAGAYFFKMLGPAATVSEQDSNFASLLQSLKVE